MSLNRRRHGDCWHSEQYAGLDNLASGLSNAKIRAVLNGLEIATLNNQVTQQKFGSLIDTFTDVDFVALSGCTHSSGKIDMSQIQKTINSVSASNVLGSYPASKAINGIIDNSDGGNTTISFSGVGHTLSFDLGSIKTVDLVKIHLGGWIASGGSYRSYGFDLQVSNDNTNWVTVFESGDYQDKWIYNAYNLFSIGADCRYIRMIERIDNGSTYGLGVSQFEAFEIDQGVITSDAFAVNATVEGVDVLLSGEGLTTDNTQVEISTDGSNWTACANIACDGEFLTSAILVNGDVSDLYYRITSKATSIYGVGVTW